MTTREYNDTWKFSDYGVCVLIVGGTILLGVAIAILVKVCQPHPAHPPHPEPPAPPVPSPPPVIVGEGANALTATEGANASPCADDARNTCMQVRVRHDGRCVVKPRGIGSACETACYTSEATCEADAQCTGTSETCVGTCSTVAFDRAAGVAECPPLPGHEAAEVACIAGSCSYALLNVEAKEGEEIDCAALLVAEDDDSDRCLRARYVESSQTCIYTPTCAPATFDPARLISADMAMPMEASGDIFYFIDDLDLDIPEDAPVEETTYLTWAWASLVSGYQRTAPVEVEADTETETAVDAVKDVEEPQGTDSKADIDAARLEELIEAARTKAQEAAANN